MDAKPDDTLRELFGDPISVFTDQQALADGVIVDLAPLGLWFRGRPSASLKRRWAWEPSVFTWQEPRALST